MRKDVESDFKQKFIDAVTDIGVVDAGRTGRFLKPLRLQGVVIDHDGIPYVAYVDDLEFRLASGTKRLRLVQVAVDQLLPF